MEMFQIILEYKVKIAYAVNGICTLVMEHWNKILEQCQQDLLVRVRECLLLRTPTVEDGDVVLPLRSNFSTAPIRDPVVAAAAAALAQAGIDERQLCFCYCDSPNMELVQMNCCKQTIH
jgi:hypothetical protein